MSQIRVPYVPPLFLTRIEPTLDRRPAVLRGNREEPADRPTSGDEPSAGAGEDVLWHELQGQDHRGVSSGAG